MARLSEHGHATERLSRKCEAMEVMVGCDQFGIAIALLMARRTERPESESVSGTESR